jgi:hypothetical protein
MGDVAATVRRSRFAVGRSPFVGRSSGQQLTNALGKDLVDDAAQPSSGSSKALTG